jgi:GNAT superfamily N-acetyltransferase
VLEAHPLSAEFDLTGFDSGEPSLDDWLRRHAMTTYVRGLARTYLLLDEDVPVGYYALTAHKISRDALPRALGRGGPEEVPAVLLAKLAVDRRFQGRGIGAVLLFDACQRVVAATRIVAARLFVVDALHEKAAEFYEHHGFRRVPGELRLVQKVSDLPRDPGE